MIIKIKSEVTGKEYEGNNLEELTKQCEADDEQFKKEEAEKKAVSEKNSKELSTLKKELSKSVEEADSKLTKAYSDYEEAKKEATKIIEDANAEVDSIMEEARKEYEKAREKARQLLTESEKKANEVLKPARTVVYDAEKEKYKAISQYNAQCGPYQVVYTGDKAVKEFQRIEKHLNETFDNVFGGFFRNFF